VGAPIEPGTILAGKYQVDKVLGEGGMGVVVAATDTQLERRVAIKFLLPEYAQHHEAGQRFMREARAAVKIQSEHIARVIDVNRMDNGSPYMVMEYLQGGDLSSVLLTRGPLPIEEATSFVLQACEAIAEAHSYGIVHRDLKPANLFLAQQPDGSSKIKVLDFGISKMTIQGSTDPSLTRTSSMMGSPLYMSPEQMRSTRNVDARADIWALGVILYELLTATPPFNGESIPTLSAKILLEEPEPLRAARPDVPLELERVVLRALRKDPADRFPTISEFALSLLPFAPRRAQHNVERITKLLRSAGLSTSNYDGSVPPPGADSVPDAMTVRDATTVPDAVQGVTSGDALVKHDRTQANFGQTRGLAKRSSALGWGLAAAGLVLLIAAGGAGMFLWKGSPEPPAHAVAQEPPRGPAEHAATQPASASAAAAAKAEPALEPKAEPALEQPDTAAPTASASATAPPETSPPPTATAAARSTAAPRRPATTKPSTAAVKPPSSSSTDGGFRSRFGSRK